MKAFLLLSIIILAAVTVAERIQNDRVMFNQYKVDYGKSYKDLIEEEMRFKIFSNNLKEIKEHNLNGKFSWTHGINKFSDRSHDEFTSILGHKSYLIPKIANVFKPLKTIDINKLPKSIDWSKRGAISPIKDQGHCGSCWAFATTEQIESYTYLNNKTLPILSPQQITSCSPNDVHCGGDGGCKGSVPQLGYTYVNLLGIASEKDYPYTSGKTQVGGKCTYNPVKNPPVATVSGYDVLPANDYTSVMYHLANVGPLAISAYASTWMNYQGGVFDGCPYNKNIDINHAVQLVGYGTDPKLGDYWKVRNSWGADWGENGYIRIKRNMTPKCGFDKTPLDGDGCKIFGNITTRVCGTCGLLSQSSYPINAGLL